MESTKSASSGFWSAAVENKRKEVDALERRIEELKAKASDLEAGKEKPADSPTTTGDEVVDEAFREELARMEARRRSS